MDANCSNSLPLILPIQILNVRVFLVRTRLGFLLVDTGIPFQEKKLLRAFQDRGIKLDDIKAIFLTHGHLDHIGCLGFLQERIGAPVICHRSLVATLESGAYEKAIPRVVGWKLLNEPVSAFLSLRLRPVAIQHAVDEVLDLSGFGLGGSILHTPGHSPGSCSLLLDDGVLLLGDLLRERKPGRLDSGLFYQDRAQILASLEKLAARRPRLIYLSHGSHISGEDLETFLAQNRI